MKWRLLVLILPCCLLGDSKVLAVDTQVTIHPDKAFYHPGEVVSLHIEAASGSRVEANILYLSDLVTSVTLPLTGGVGELIWTPPPLAPRGYGVDMRIIAEDGTTLTTSSSAFDVLEGWTQAPRYGFLTQFEPGRNNIAETMDWVSRFHLNGLQFYDWQYRHEALLPPSSSDVYTDLLGRRMSMQTVNALIEAAHTHNIAAMPYTAIYGASKAFYDEHPDWALFQAPGEPYRFGDNFLMIMNPSSGSGWAEHLLAEFARVLDETAFDGIHIDQYGAPKVGLNNQGERVSLDTVFPEFINQAAEVVQARRGDQGAVIFNAVGNWPVDTIAPSNENAVYIEVWQPYRNFMDLHRSSFRHRSWVGVSQSSSRPISHRIARLMCAWRMP